MEIGCNWQGNLILSSKAVSVLPARTWCLLCSGSSCHAPEADNCVPWVLLSSRVGEFGLQPFSLSPAQHTLVPQAVYWDSFAFFPWSGPGLPRQVCSHGTKLSLIRVQQSFLQTKWGWRGMKSKETVLDTLWRNQNIWLWFIFFFLMEEGTLNCCLSVGPAVSRAVSEPRVDTPSLDYLPSAAQTTASLPEAMGNSTGRSFSFPQHLLSHFHACVAV